METFATMMADALGAIQEPVVYGYGERFED
jgi:hypothetical protein